jgi:hyaluronan synthase
VVTTILQLRHTLDDHGHLYLFTVFVVLIWFVWLVKVVLSRRYRPWTDPYHTTTTVVIPVVDEPLDLFREVLQRITEQTPTQVLVVINGPPNPGLEAVCGEFADVEWRWTPVAGKRNAVRVGVEEARGEIVLLVDSDTIWTEGTLSELMKPFRDPRVGGVTTRQRILDPDRNFLTRWADWLESSRALYSMPAQSVLGQIGCLPGRTIAFRRVVLERAMPDFLTQRFMGVFLEVSDDRTLTNLTLKQGYRTVYQSTSLVYTDAPLRLKKLAKQQYRWARGSQYNTLRMLPWMCRHAPILAFFFVLDIVLPFLWLCSAMGWVVRSFEGQSANLYGGILGHNNRPFALLAMFGLVVISSWLSMSLRQQRHLEQRPGDIVFMPLFVVFSTVFLMPIRMYGFARLGHAGGWGTRNHAYAGGDAPTDDSGVGAGGAEDEADARWPPAGSPGTGAPGAGTSHSATLLQAAPASRSGAPARRHLNPYAAIPYFIALALIVGGTLYDAWPH